MRQNNDSVPVENEITPELASVLTAMQTWDVPLQECSGVEGHDAGMCVGPQKGCPPKCKASVAVPVRIKRDHEGKVEPILEARGSLSRFERDDHHGRACPLEPVIAFCHLHEMAFAQ